MKVRSPIDHRWRYYEQYKASSRFTTLDLHRFAGRSRSLPVNGWPSLSQKAEVTVGSCGGVTSAACSRTRRRLRHTGSLILILWVDNIWLSGRKQDQIEFYVLEIRSSSTFLKLEVHLGKRFDTRGVTVTGTLQARVPPSTVTMPPECKLTSVRIILGFSWAHTTRSWTRTCRRP